MQKKIFLLFALFLASQCVFSQEYTMNDLLREMQEMKAEMRQLKSQVQEQQDIISNLRGEKKRPKIDLELQKEVESLQKEVAKNSNALDALKGEQDFQDVLDPSPEEGFNNNHAFFVKVGLIRDAFENGYGWMVAGVIDHKLFDSEYGSFLGEIGVSFARSKERFDVVTSAVLGALVNQELRLSTLTVDLGFKYRLDRLGEPNSFLRRFQPYGRAGIAMQVFISDSDSNIGGQVPQAAELEDENIPSGQGNIYLALNLGAGFEFMLTRSFFLGIDYGHYELFTEHGRSNTIALTTGLRF